MAEPITSLLRARPVVGQYRHISTVSRWQAKGYAWFVAKPVSSPCKNQLAVGPLIRPYNQPKGLQISSAFSSRYSRLIRGRMAQRKPKDVIIPPMPMRLNELVVLMRCLESAFESERTSKSDKTVVREIMRRINLFAERQG